MATEPADRLDELLPYVYRLRDSARGEPLRALLRVITEQVEVVEADIRQLYDNWFIETCQQWVVPYLGDLIGYQPLREPAGGAPGRILSPRADVAHAIGDRRRKGTLALLEQLAADAAHWPARAAEFYPLVGVTQPVRLFGAGPAADGRRLLRGRTADLRSGDALERCDGPFDELTHTAGFRRYNLPNVGLFVWRLAEFRITGAPASCIDRARGRYTFSILGNDTPLLTRPLAEPEPTHIAEEMNVPAFIRRRAFDERTPDYYGPERSLFVWRDAERHPVPLAHVVPADLSGWAYRPRGDEVAIDPVLGRIAFAPGSMPETGVWVSYSYGFSARIGGGEYERELSPLNGRPVYPVGGNDTLMKAIQQWQRDKAADPGKSRAIVEIRDSGVYEEPIEIDLAPGDRLEIRAAPGTRPVIRLMNWYSNRPDSMRIRGTRLTAKNAVDIARAPRLVLDGLLITGRGVRVTGLVGSVIVRHCTLVPGWSVDADCEPDSEGEPSIDFTGTAADLTVEHSIVGVVRVNENRVETDPIRFTASDSILDGTGPEHHAFSGPDGRPARAHATVARTTVLGRMCVQTLDLAEDSIFADGVAVARRGTGCVRFCYVPPSSRTPRRYHCQPDVVLAAIRERPDAKALTVRELLRVRPLFESRRYGVPQYARLALDGPPEIGEGAHDESEMGAFHDLFQPQRTANLRARLDQYTPAGTVAGIGYVT
jgi:hypothetical protein